MDFISSALTIIGYILMAVGWIWILVLTFQDSILLGVLCLIIPFVGLYAVFKAWPESKPPLLAYVAGTALAVVGALIGGAGATG
jgi:hypothetical protein